MNPSPRHRLSLLIGDDDTAVRECVADLVSERGFEIFMAATGSESLQILVSRSIDLTILDVHMPDLTGIEVFERFVRGAFIAGPQGAPVAPEGRRLDAIFMSADATPEIRGWCRTRGRRLLDKPFEPDAMRAAIDAVLTGRQFD
ncbi:MAG: response regulator [Planctomycetota bacterium]|jgi:CheY-like chemotaxis protein